MTKLKKLSDNSLSELQNLMWDVTQRMWDYQHVFEFIPTPLKREIQDFIDRLNIESDSRNERYYDK